MWLRKLWKRTESPSRVSTCPPMTRVTRTTFAPLVPQEFHSEKPCPVFAHLGSNRLAEFPEINGCLFQTSAHPMREKQAEARTRRVGVIVSLECSTARVFIRH